jgi:predicted RNA-binding Zn ribbon-like protein
VDLSAYAELAVRLVNTTGSGQGRGDGLASVESFRSLVADRPQYAGRVTVTDLEALRLLREELRLVFTAVAQGRDTEAADRLNALLTRHPIHQELTRHDGRRWHLHLVDSGSASDRYAAGAIAGLTGLIAESGTRRLGICAADGCDRVYAGNGAGRDKRYCSAQCTPEASVRALRTTGGAGDMSAGHGPASTAASL